jgi:hypothetical protein
MPRATHHDADLEAALVDLRVEEEKAKGELRKVKAKIYAVTKELRKRKKREESGS